MIKKPQVFYDCAFSLADKTIEHNAVKISDAVKRAIDIFEEKQEKEFKKINEKLDKILEGQEKG